VTRYSSGAEGVGVSHDFAFDFVLVDKLKDVWRVDENGRGTGDRNCQKYTQLKPVDHQGNVSPVVQYLTHDKRRN